MILKNFLPLPRAIAGIAGDLLIACLWAVPVGAAQYYVDFSSGADSAAGTSTSTAWKHSPGDANATGTAGSTKLAAGDVVNLKGGVSYNGGIAVSQNGTSGQPIVWQTAANGWGSGNAIMEGTVGTTTNSCAFHPEGEYHVISGLTIQDYSSYAVEAYGGNASYLVVSNCNLHHIGWFPYAINGDGGVGYGVYLRGLGNAIIVSNRMDDLNETAVYAVYSATNLIIWGNTLTNIQDHAIFSACYGYTLIACNAINWQTNSVTHDDGMQIQGGGGTEPSKSVIVCGNTEWANNQDLFFNPLANGPFDAYVFNNVWINPYSDGTGQTGTPQVGFTMEIQSPGTLNNLYVFNNLGVLMNSGYGMTEMTYYVSASVLNLFYYNNLNWNGLTSYNINTAQIQHIYSGYNLYTNDWRSTYIIPELGGTWQTLAQFQASNPTLEINSLYGYVAFPNILPGGVTNYTYKLTAGDSAIGKGTNLAAMLPSSTFNFLPSPYMVDPTQDILGQQRSSAWDIGAYAYQSTPPAPPTDLTVAGAPE